MSHIHQIFTETETLKCVKGSVGWMRDVLKILKLEKKKSITKGNELSIEKEYEYFPSYFMHYLSQLQFVQHFVQKTAYIFFCLFCIVSMICILNKNN